MMTGRVLEADRWISEVRQHCREAGSSTAEIGSLCLILAGALQTEQGLWFMRTCVDAERKLGVTHSELANILQTAASRLTLVDLGHKTP